MKPKLDGVAAATSHLNSTLLNIERGDKPGYDAPVPLYLSLAEIARGLEQGIDQARQVPPEHDVERSVYMTEWHNEVGGGGEVLTCITLADGKYIVLGYDQVCVYTSKDAYWERDGEVESEVLFAADTTPKEEARERYAR